MAKTVVVELKVNAKAAEGEFQDLGDVIQEQKEITQEFREELVRLERQLKETPSKNLGRQRDLKKEIDRTKDAIKEQGVAVKGLELQQKKLNKTNVKSTQTYFESKEALTDVNRLTAEFALKVKAVKNIVVESIAKLVSFAKAQKLAFAAGGIGVLLIALAAVATFWVEIEEAITGANKKLQAQIKLTNRLLANIKTEITQLDKLIELEKLRGNNVDDLIEEKKRLVKIQQIETTQALVLAQADLVRTEELAKRVGFWEQISRQSRGGAVATGDSGITEAEQKAIQAAKDRRDEFQNLLLDLQKISGILNDQFPNATDGTGGTEVGVDGGQSQFQRRAEQNTNLLFQAQEFQKSLTDIQRDALEQRTQDREQSAKDEVAIEQLTSKQKLAIIASTFGSIATIVGQNTAAGKALAIAQATINVLLGVTDVWASKSETGLVGAGLLQKIATTAAVLASGMATVRQITQTPVPSVGGGVSGASGASAAAVPVQPNFNIVGQSGVNQIAEAIGEQGNKPVKTYVVAKDVETAMELDRNIVQGAGV